MVDRDIPHQRVMDLRILIVDDSEPTRRILATIVRSRGCGMDIRVRSHGAIDPLHDNGGGGS
jgi:hypothetical protein